MLKLKIGRNYLITTTNTTNASDLYSAIAYMMGCFRGEGCIAVTPSLSYSEDQYHHYMKEVIQELRSKRIAKIYVLTTLSINPRRKRDKQLIKLEICNKKEFNKFFINDIKNALPNLQIKVISTNSQSDTEQYKISYKIMKELEKSKDFIINDLTLAERYKAISLRTKEIPQELQVVENELKKLEANSMVCEYKTTLKSLEYLNLIESATILGTNLVLCLKPLPIYPSEDIGLIFTKAQFNSNPYLYKATKYIYEGNHFKMPGTKIKIDNNFRPHFCETLEHDFDRMLNYSNWSHIGYPHFGASFCAGEFNDVMAHGREYGLTYYFIALKQYLTTANMRDTAGYRVWWYPIYNDHDELIYCAGYDTLIEEYIQKSDPALYQELQEMSWTEKITTLNQKKYGFNELDRSFRPDHLNYRTSSGEDSFLELLSEKEPTLYEKITQERKK